MLIHRDREKKGGDNFILPINGGRQIRLSPCAKEREFFCLSIIVSRLKERIIQIIIIIIIVKSY